MPSKRNFYSAPTRAFLFALSATRLSGVAAAVLDVPHLDPVVPEKKMDLIPPRHVYTEVRKERPQTRLLLSLVMRHVAFSPRST
jgi:hypothetical protein